MTRSSVLDGSAVVHDVVVVAFDMCSSSRIIEDLTRTDSLRQYDRLLRNLRVWLANSTEAFGYVLYKFTGDGWILLFPSDQILGEVLIEFLQRLSAKYDGLRSQLIDEHLESIPQSKGLTYGIDVGPVRKLILGNEQEFVGRAINVACRLQSAVKDRGTSPEYQCLLSRKVFNTYMKKVQGHHFGPAKRRLKNISGGEDYRCFKVFLGPTLL